MARTFNRNPLQVNTPSSNDVKNYFFNHCNWKGVNNDKNFLTVDQETFADAKNIYVDAEGLLRSRPSVKRKTMFFDSAIDFWNFDDVDVYLNRGIGNIHTQYVLYFIKNGISKSKSVINDNIKLVKIQNSIYCFTDDDFFYFDVTTGELGDGFEKIYVPNTVYDALGVKTKVESKNILTDRENFTYLFNRKYGISSEVYDKKLSVKINGKKYETVFDEYTPELLSDLLIKIPSGYEAVVSNDNTFLFFSKERRTISYSATGKTITKNFILPEDLGEIIGSPKFSQDSRYIIVGTTKSLYIVSVIADTSSGQLRFEDFTDVKDYVSELEWRQLDDVSSYEQKIDFDFVTYDKFVYFITYVDYDNSVYRTLIGCKEDSFDWKETDVEDSKIGRKISYSTAYRHYTEHELLYDSIIVFVADDMVSNQTTIEIMDNWFNSTIVDTFTRGTGTVMDVRIFTDRISFLKKVNGIDFIVTLSQSNDASNPFIIDEYEYFFGSSSNHFLSSDGLKIAIDNTILFLDTNTLKDIIAKDTCYAPIAYNDYLYYKDDEDNIFTNFIDKEIEFNYTSDGKNNYIQVDKISKLNEFYVSSGKTLNITSYREEDGEFRWYLPELNAHTFDETITGLHPISSSEMGIFFENSIWYGFLSEQIYHYTKTKLELGIKSGSDITTSYDGSYLIFPTERGIVTLSYQDFVASTDQVLTFLSDAVHLQMKEFCKEPVSIFKNDYWIFVYRKDFDKLYVLDIRNNSWWPWSLSNRVKKFVNYNDEIIFLSTNGFCRFNESTENYFDYDGKRHTIEWNLTSQKLHLSQMNNYKHIVNMTFNSVIDTEDYLTFFLEITNYREQVDSGKVENPHYSVDVLRTFVQRLNYFKVNEFQYTLRSDNENKIPLPLSLSSISIKYKIQGQVR